MQPDSTIPTAPNIPGVQSPTSRPQVLARPGGERVIQPSPQLISAIQAQQQQQLAQSPEMPLSELPQQPVVATINVVQTLQPTLPPRPPQVPLPSVGSQDQVQFGRSASQMGLSQPRGSKWLTLFVLLVVVVILLLLAGGGYLVYQKFVISG